MTDDRASIAARERWANTPPEVRRSATTSALTASALNRERSARLDALAAEAARREGSR